MTWHYSPCSLGFFSFPFVPVISTSVPNFFSLLSLKFSNLGWQVCIYGLQVSFVAYVRAIAERMKFLCCSGVARGGGGGGGGAKGAFAPHFFQDLFIFLVLIYVVVVCFVF